jgi:sugar transferase (PEP-CTERM/EpsH1 system associated)
MKLMVCTSRVPYPLDKGDKLRAYYQIKELSKKHEIYLCCLNNEALSPETHSELNKYCKEVHIFQLNKVSIFINLLLSVFTVHPLHVAYFYNRRHKASIQKIHDNIQPDRILCQLIRMAPYVISLSSKKCIDFMDVFSVGIKRRAKKSKLFLKPVFYYEAFKLKRYEVRCARLFDAQCIISEADKHLLPLIEKGEIKVIANGVDFDFFKKSTTETIKKYDLVFVGNMSYAPNILAAEFLANQIMPALCEIMPTAKLLLAGTNPDKKVKALATKQIVVSGFIKDIRDAYNQAHLFIAPMQIGTGLQNKLLEAMAMEIPCITSPLAAKGIKASSDSLRCGSSITEYVDHILALLNNPAEKNKQVSNALLFVKKKYHWRQICNDLDKMLQG